MSNFRGERESELEMGVWVLKAKTGKKEGIVSERDLEKYGWGTDPLGSVVRWQETMNCHCDGGFIKCEPNEETGVVDPNCAVCGGWPDDVVVSVKTDEESGHPVRGFRIVADIGFRTTRHQKALREIGQYLINLANGCEDDSGFYGQGIEVIEEA